MLSPENHFLLKKITAYVARYTLRVCKLLIKSEFLENSFAILHSNTFVKHCVYTLWIDKSSAINLG